MFSAVNANSSHALRIFCINASTEPFSDSLKCTTICRRAIRCEKFKSAWRRILKVKHFSRFFKLLVLNYAEGLVSVQKATALLSSSRLPFNHLRQNRLITLLLREWDSKINRLLVK